MKLTSVAFLYFLLLSILLSVSSQTWFTLWVGMEMSLIFFVPFFLSGSEKTFKSISVWKYMVVSSVSSAIMFSAFLIYFGWFPFSVVRVSIWVCEFVVLVCICVKLGMFPFHEWLMKVGENSSWAEFASMNTLMKLIPLSVVWFVSMTWEEEMMIGVSSVISSLLVSARLTVRRFMVASSLVNMGWAMVFSQHAMDLLVLFVVFYILGFGTLCLLMSKEGVVKAQDLISSSEKPMGLMKLGKVALFVVVTGLPPSVVFALKVQMISELCWWEPILALQISSVVLLSFYMLILYSSIFVAPNPVKVVAPKWTSCSLMVYFLISLVFVLGGGLYLLS
nr:NADH dehydrogenase subunit 2 [Craspedonirmus immer]